MSASDGSSAFCGLLQFSVVICDRRYVARSWNASLSYWKLKTVRKIQSPQPIRSTQLEERVRESLAEPGKAMSRKQFNKLMAKIAGGR
jgi:hypothetical protein